jgi:hypothetical protein
MPSADPLTVNDADVAAAMTMLVEASSTKRRIGTADAIAGATARGGSPTIPLPSGDKSV